jgi:hypothetical protein
MVMPNFQNPLGFQMSDERKRAMVEMLARHDVPVIENDVYHELYYGDVHPTSLKNYDTRGLVLHCNSFSKTLSPANRIGWTLPGRYKAQVEKLKFLNTLNTPPCRNWPSPNTCRTTATTTICAKCARLTRSRPASCRRRCCASSRRDRRLGAGRRLPAVGDAAGRRACTGAARAGAGTRHQRRRGNIFATGDAFQHCIRLNYSYPWSAEVEAAVRTWALSPPNWRHKTGATASSANRM